MDNVGEERRGEEDGCLVAKWRTGEGDDWEDGRIEQRETKKKGETVDEAEKEREEEGAEWHQWSGIDGISGNEQQNIKKQTNRKIEEATENA